MKSFSIQVKASFLLTNVIHNERLHPLFLSSESFITQGRSSPVNSDQSCPLPLAFRCAGPCQLIGQYPGRNGKLFYRTGAL